MRGEGGEKVVTKSKRAEIGRKGMKNFLVISTVES